MTKKVSKTINLFTSAPGISLATHESYTLKFKPLQVHSLEMEDVLFHLDSAVLMPSTPQGASAGDGSSKTSASESKSQDKTDEITGIRALATVFKQFEFKNQQRLIIAGHTDTSGKALYNFKLAEKRALGVLYLLRGRDINGNKVDRDLWAKNSAGQHRIEDYQQIMQYFCLAHPKWACDPGKLDNKWGPHTEQATRNFFAANTLSEQMAQKVVNDGKHLWPEPAWVAVFALYEQEMASALGLKSADELDKSRTTIKYLDQVFSIRACGESFPIDKTGQDGYRSQKNRRVEILFFRNEDLPPKTSLVCPPARDSAHKAHECPLWNKGHVKLVHLDPNDLKCTAYHLKFLYYDRIKQKWGHVPQGLNIEVEETVGGKKALVKKVRVDYGDGNHIVKVPDNPDRTDINFLINHKQPAYVFTEDKDAEPEIRFLDSDSFAALAALEKEKHYDLPLQWSSFNYWVRDDESSTKGKHFQDAVAKRNLKPQGAQTTSPDKPLIFSLEDIVLVDERGRQNIQDEDERGHAQDLSPDSRLIILYLDPANDSNMAIYKPRSEARHFSNVPFGQNLVTDVPARTRLVVFCSRLYHVTRSRTTTSSGFDSAHGHVLGARAAVLDDDAVHYGQSIVPRIGNYELHYCHDCGVLDGQPLSYLVIYWNCRFVAGEDESKLASGWKENWMRQALSGAMDRSNRPYIMKTLAETGNPQIKFFHVFEAKLDHLGGKHKCTARIYHHPEGTWMGRNKAQFDQRFWRELPGYYGNAGDLLQDVDGKTYHPNTVAHECGHAAGCLDDYQYSLTVGNETFYGIPSFAQPNTAPGGPYSIDKLARMFENRVPRMRNFWHFVDWINDSISMGFLMAFMETDATYQLTYTFKGASGSQTIAMNFSEPNYRNPDQPSFSENNIRLNSTGHTDLLLYKTGGETAYTLDKGRIYDGILVVRLLLEVDFNRGFWDWLSGSKWSHERKQNWLEQLKLALDKMNRFYLRGPEGHDFSQTKLVIRPFFWMSGGATGGPNLSPHCRIEISLKANDAFQAGGHTLKVGRAVSHQKLLSYLLGKDPAGALVRDDFLFTTSWMDKLFKNPGAFSIHDV